MKKPKEETTKWVIDRVPLPEPNRTPRVGRAKNEKDFVLERFGSHQAAWGARTRTHIFVWNRMMKLCEKRTIEFNYLESYELYMESCEIAWKSHEDE